jgi:hypothetical protein
MRGITGVSGAGPIFKSIMLELHRNQSVSWYKIPSSIQPITVDPHTGKQLSSSHPKFHLGINTYAQKSATPLSASDSDYYSTGKGYLDNTYRSWLNKNPNKAFTSKRLALSTRNLRIISPSDSSRFLLDPDLPNNGKFLALKSNSANLTQWRSDTLEIITRENLPVVILKPGIHKLTATDRHTPRIQHDRIHRQKLIILLSRPRIRLFTEYFINILDELPRATFALVFFEEYITQGFPVFISRCLYIFPDSGVRSSAFQRGGEFPILGMIDPTVKAHAFLGLFFPLMSLLNLHGTMLIQHEREIN